MSRCVKCNDKFGAALASASTMPAPKCPESLTIRGGTRLALARSVPCRHASRNFACNIAYLRTGPQFHDAVRHAPPLAQWGEGGGVVRRNPATGWPKREW